MAADQQKSQKGLPVPEGAAEPSRQLPDPHVIYAPQGARDAQDPQIRSAALSRIERRHVRTHYYVKIGVSTFLCALLLLIGVPVFMESRVTGSLSYTALGVVLVAFGLALAVAVVILLFNPPFRQHPHDAHGRTSL